MAENTGRKQRGKPFTAGQSGNPAGRPKGARHRATLAAEAMLDGEAQALTRKAIERALEGDGVALRLCLERILPPRKDRAISVSLPKMEAASDAIKAMTAILAGVARGDLTSSEAGDVVKLIDAFAKAIELRDLEGRVAELEKREAAK